ncbi:TPA: hypothetical protein ACTYIV_004093 [Citrobacter koseri]|uniref:hypothetical protein n=1 Tax=Citrobacter koseri TaxID=545 RepID=UPI000D9E7E8D|nr:hypothetical protein [Citrobacter koseri]SQB66341.1 Uncharacterised protein [Citrobacter koseri]
MTNSPMTTNNHPAHGPVSLDRLHQMREYLERNSQYQNGGNRAYILADMLKVIAEAMAARNTEPVTVMNNKLTEWRKALNKAVENYQSAQAWYEENQDSPSAQQDMDEAEGGIEKLIRQYGVLIVLNLLDEIDELQERRRVENAEPIYQCEFCHHDGNGELQWHWEDVNKDFYDQYDSERRGKRRILYTAPPVPIMPDGYVIVPIVPTEDMIINGFESVPDPHFSDEKEWEEYEALSGCRQAARRAELCWAAMIKAVPKQENI